MKSSLELKNLTHHAYCLIGGDSILNELVLLLNKKHSIVIQGNSDFFQRKYQNFTIDDARELKLAHEMRPVTDEGKKIFVIQADSITVEAQNALLKLLEEPAEYVHFFLIVPIAHLLLPTVRSRLLFIETNIEEDGSEEKVEAKKFLKLPLAKRLETIKKLVDDIAKEKKTKQDAVDFLDAIQAEIYSSGDLKRNFESLKAIEIARKYVTDRAPSLKMLLEYVALNI